MTSTRQGGSRRFAPGLLLLACAACEGTDSIADRVAVRDSAGVRVVTTIRTEWPGALPLELEPVAIIPSNEPGVAPVGRIFTARVLAGGAIALIDDLSRNVRIYGADGRHLATVGREGQGPGEFRGPTTLQALEDGSFTVYDLSLRRTSTFDSVGSLISTASFTGGLFEASVSRAWYMGPDVVLTWESDALDSVEVRGRSATAERLVLPGRLRLVDRARGTARTILTGTEAELIREGSSILPPFFGARAWMTTTPQDLIFAEGTLHEVHWINPLSGTHAIARYPGGDRAFDQDELEDLHAEHRAMAAAAGTTVRFESRYDLRLQPEMRPALGRLAAGPDGTVWAKVFNPGARESTWWIVNVHDGFRGLVELPRGTDVMAITDEHLLVRRSDELDVQRLELWLIPDQFKQQ